MKDDNQVDDFQDVDAGQQSEDEVNEDKQLVEADTGKHRIEAAKELFPNSNYIQIGGRTLVRASNRIAAEITRLKGLRDQMSEAPRTGNKKPESENR